MVGEIVNVCADESVLTDGKIDPAKLRPIVFDGANHTYHVLGEQVGRAFHDGAALKYSKEWNINGESVTISVEKI